MLKHRLKLLSAVMALFAAISIPAQAEGTGRATIPFDFVVYDVTYPAGSYDVTATSSPRVIIMRNEANLKQSFMLVLPLGETLANGTAHLRLTPSHATPPSGLAERAEIVPG